MSEVSRLLHELKVDESVLREVQEMWEIAAIGTFAQSLEDRMNIEYDQYDLELGFLVWSPTSILTRLVNVLVSRGRSFNDKVVSRIQRWLNGLPKSDDSEEALEKAAVAMKIDRRVFEFIKPLADQDDELDFYQLPVKTRVWTIKSICDEKALIASRHMSGRGAEPATFGRNRRGSGLCFTSFLPHVRAFDGEICVALKKSDLEQYLTNGGGRKSGVPAELKGVVDEDAEKACISVLNEFIESVQREEEEQRKQDAKVTEKRKAPPTRKRREETPEPQESDKETSEYEEESEIPSDSPSDSDYEIPVQRKKSRNLPRGTRKQRSRLTGGFQPIRVSIQPPANFYQFQMKKEEHDADYYVKQRKAIQEASKVFFTRKIPAHAMPLALNPTLKKCENKKYLTEPSNESTSSEDEELMFAQHGARGSIFSNGAFPKEAAPPPPPSRPFCGDEEDEITEPPPGALQCELDGLFSYQVLARFRKAEAQRKAKEEAEQQRSRKKRPPTTQKSKTEDNDEEHNGVISNEYLMSSVGRLAKRLRDGNNEQRAINDSTDESSE